MKSRESLINLISPTILGIFILGSLLAPLNSALAAPPSILSYQGRLTNSSGALLGGSSGTTYYLKFSIWSAASGGSKLWPTADPTAVAITVREGLFNINIGDTANGYPDALDYAFDRANTFLKVEVSTDNVSFETLAPRQQINSTAYARVAGAVESASSTITNLTSANATIKGVGNIKDARRKIRGDLHNIDRLVEKSFDILKEDISDAIHTLERARTKRKLTPEEDAIIHRLRQNLVDAEKIIHKEIVHVEKGLGD